MKNFLLFNDFSSEAEHAAEIALLLAGRTYCNLYVWNTIEYTSIPAAELVMARTNEAVADVETQTDKNIWIEKLESKLNWETGLKPTVHFIDDVEYVTDNVLAVVKKYDIGLLIRGTASDDEHNGYIEGNVLRSATKSGCPVMVVPKSFSQKGFNNIVYPTDLRFCRYDVVTYLTQFSKFMSSSVLVANISERGLPHMEENYAQSVFEDALLNSANRDCLYFSNIKERNIPKALDILVNDLDNDLLVLVNNKFHFNELLGHDAPYAIPANIRAPLLIFPS